MKFARWVFAIAGLWGVIVITPLYFLFDAVGRENPPPISHAEYYYGFTGVTLAWQVAFFVIAANPARFRPMMIPAVLEKVLYVMSIVPLYAQARVSTAVLSFAAVDAGLGVLFIAAFLWSSTARE